MRARWGAFAVVVALVVLCSPGDRASARVQNAGPGRPDDSTTLAGLLAAARGANPVLCGLAARAVEQEWGDFFPGDVTLPASGGGAVLPTVPALLRMLRNPAVVTPLGAAIADRDPCVRRLAAPLLGRTRQPRAVELLRNALAEHNADVRAAGALGLGFAQHAGTVAPLIAALRDSAPQVRAMAAWALGEIEDTTARAPLTRLLIADDAADVRKAAAWALGKLK